MPTLPTNPHYIGDSGHVNDHNTIVSALQDIYAFRGVYQVKSTTKTDVFTVSLSAGAVSDITGLSVSITPTSASNKILVMASVTGSRAYTIAGFGIRVVRGTTPILAGTADGNRLAISASTLAAVDYNEAVANVSTSGLDSPATTTATTYKVAIHSNITGGPFTWQVNRTASDTDAAYTGRFASSITVMEVAP